MAVWMVCVSEGIVTNGPLPVMNALKSPLPMPNPLDERAVEMATTLREQYGGKVVLVSVGNMSEEVWEYYLGLGAEEGIRVEEAGLSEWTPPQVARVLASVARTLRPQVIFCGERCVNGIGTGWVPFLLGTYLAWPVLPGVAQTSLREETIQVERVVERGYREVLAAPLPCVVSVAETAPLTRYSAIGRAHQARVRRTTLGDWGLSREALLSLPWTVRELSRVQARPRPRKLYVPPSTMSAADRLAALLAGGTGASRGSQDSKFFEGTPQQAARVILDFLKQEGIFP